MNSRPIRLQKFLAQCGIASRRKAEQLIADGVIAVDGKIVTEMGTLIFPDTSSITFNGKILQNVEQKVYYLVNKPKGYVTTLHDPQGRPIVRSLLPPTDLRLFPVGRLDLDTEGALIMTNDGVLAQKIQHPSGIVYKTYEAIVRGNPNLAQLSVLERGIVLEGKLTAPAKIRVIESLRRNAVLEITIHEGRKRQIKKMCQFIGHPVLSLKRIAYGKLSLGNLPIGHYRKLTPSDLEKIFL